MINYTLCLSGGGFRAALFHLGVIRRLIYLDLFDRVERINSVSGGSIAAGVVMKELSSRRFNSVEDFDLRVIAPFVEFIQSSPRRDIYKFIPLRKNPIDFAKYLEQKLFGDFSFADLSLDLIPMWFCYATSLTSGCLWRFSPVEIGDADTGTAQPNKMDKVAIGVAASACYLPLFKALKFSTENRSFICKYKNGKEVNTQNSTPPAEIHLSDGGVYDNLASDVLLNRDTPFIISDASGSLNHWQHSIPSLTSMIVRPLNILMKQNGRLKRLLHFKQLMNSEHSVMIEAVKLINTYTEKTLLQKEAPTHSDQMPKYPTIHRDLEIAIGNIRTDLNAFHDLEISLLIWDGMTKIDAVLKRWTPHVIKECYWDDVPPLNMDNSQQVEAINVLLKGCKMKPWGEHHKLLHLHRPFLTNITDTLGRKVK